MKRTPKTYRELVLGDVDKQFTPHERPMLEENPMTAVFNMAPVVAYSGGQLGPLFTCGVAKHWIPPKGTAPACVLIQDDAHPDLVIKFLAQVQHCLAEVLG